MFRYQKFNYLAQSFQLSKNAVYNLDSLILVKDIKLEVGHLKPNNTYPEHGLLLFELSNQAPEVRLIKHGKRLKNTILLGSAVSSFRKWAVLDRLVNVIVPLISDIQARKAIRLKNSQGSYTWRWRYFFEWAEMDSLLTERIIRKDVYLPLFITTSLTNSTSSNSTNKEQVLRMFRLPFNFYTKP